MSVKLPSGMIGEVRGLTGKDGRYLTNEQKIRDNEVEGFVLSNCWARTLDEGPYHLKGSAPDWDNALIGDRFYAMIAIREATYPGKEYPLKLQCGRTGCRRKFEWEISLQKLLDEKTKMLAEADREIFAKDNLFVENLPLVTPAKKFVFKLKTGGDAKRTMKYIESKKFGTKKMQERQNLMIDSLASYIVEIEGVAKKRDAIFDFLEECPLGTIDETMPLIQSHDCGVNTDIDVECPHCHGGMIVTLPFDRAFFLPSSAAAKFEAALSNTDKKEEETTDPLAL
jgi:hypothetical protein